MASLQELLLDWYRRHRRVLPWRERPEPYRVWVSELMLQQTRVATVLPYFERFMARFPDVRALAVSSEEDVLALWSGLGYYRRARALHRAARWLVYENGGRFPETLDGWLALPGVGRYTAGAIVSIAFGKRAPILDGNVARVLSRVFGVRGDPRDAAAAGRLWELAETILPKRGVSAFNQALMELGALVCTPRKPSCLLCPLEARCVARRDGVTELLPELKPRQRSIPVTLAVAVVQKGGRVLMFQRKEHLMEGLWELPGGTALERESPRSTVVREARARYGLSLEAGEELARVKHHIMNRRITLHAFAGRLLARSVEKGPGKAWVEPSELRAYPVSSMTRKVLERLRSD